MTVTPQLKRKGVEGVILGVEAASWEDRGHQALQSDRMTDVGAAVADGNNSGTGSSGLRICSLV